MVLRYLFQAWLQQTARQKLQEAVLNTAKQKLSEGASAAAGCEAADETCDVACLFALGVESGGFEDLVTDGEVVRADGFSVRRGSLGRRSLVIALSGPGQTKAAHATDAVIAAHKPKLVISAGFGGGLSPELRRNDIVVASSVRRLDGSEIPLEGTAPTHWPRAFAGRLLTVDRVVRLPAEKREMGASTDALVVDMETYAVAEVCRQRAVPLLAVRVVIDAMDDELPTDVERLLDQKSTAARLGVAMGAFLQRPSSAVDLYKLKERSLLATDRLAKFLADAIQRQVT
jgi:adenosylhomocysteine nucleosidase